MEYRQKFAKLAVATVGTALSFAAVMKVNPASAAVFSFTQAGYDLGAGTLSGTFSTNSTSSSIALTDLSAFSATYSDSNLPSFNSSYSLGDLSSFNYNPSGTPALSFIATNPSTFSVNVPLRSSFGTVVRGGAVTDPSFNQVTTGQSAVVVPEPMNVMGVMLVGLAGLGGLLKKKAVSSQKA